MSISPDPPSLNPLSYVVLALVGDGGAGAHDLVRMMRQGGPVYWGGAPSGLYSEPKRLARCGYLRAHEEPGQTHPRTRLPADRPRARRAARWLAGASRFPRIKNEAHLRLLAGDLTQTRRSSRASEACCPSSRRFRSAVEEMYAQADRVPARARYLRLSHSYARKLIALHREWVAEVERELVPPPHARPAGPGS